MADNFGGSTTVPSQSSTSQNAAGFANQFADINLFRKGFMLNDTYDEPTYLTFYLDFDFQAQMTDNMTSLNASPLFDPGTSTDEVKTSAVSYLTQKYSGAIGDYLTNFINTLRYVTNDTPWYFQSISGLDKIWANTTAGLKSGVIGNVVLNVGCLEAIDLRIMSLAEYYNKAVYDNKWMRYRLPDNLRHFNMRIYVGEVRDIYSNLNAANNVNSASADAIVSAARNVTGRPDPNSPDQSNSATVMRFNSFFYVYFDCYQCEFDFSPMFGGQSGRFNAFTEKEPYKSGFNIKIGRFEVAGGFGPNNYSSNLFRDQYLDSGQLASLGQSVTDSITSSTSAQLSQENISLSTLAQSLGPFSNAVTNAIGQAQAALTTALSVPSKIINSALSEVQNAVDGNKFGNLYGNAPLTEPAGPTGPKDLGNIYGL